MNVQLTLATRIGQKSLSLNKEKAALDRKLNQIEMAKASLPVMEADIAQKQAEVDVLLDLKVEADILMKKRNDLQRHTDGLMEKFGAIKWHPDLAWEDKIESTDYAAKVAERHAINTRLVEIEKIANKTYYRR